MTTDDLRLGQPAATRAARSRAVLRPLLALLLAAPVLPALAAPEPAPVVPETIAPTTDVIVPAELELALPAVAGPAATAVAPQLAKPVAATRGKAPAAAAPGGLRQKADAAANATLAALLPHLAGNDSIPLLDRSAMFAGDVSRLLAAYDLSQGVPAQSTQGPEGRVQQVLKAAMSLIGTPYRWGGTSTEGFDWG